ncbi:MAG TPA: ChaN family lipoprotein, partial [Nitrospira sp.]|nr:ChaN family lipoprotein [Nitrospira sp.]
ISVACAGREPSASSGPVMEAATSFRSWQIIDTANEQSISIEELMRHLLQQEVVYLGEEHHNRFHIETALSLLNSLSQAGRRPVVAMEMFGWESQPLLDRYVQGNDLTRQDFLSQIGWTQNWGGPFETYEPLVMFPKTEHLRLVALNPPKPLVRVVAKKGLAQARREEDWTRWKMQEETIVDDPSYRQKIFEQLRACHGGGSDDMYQTMYEASMVRDEGMAKTIVSLVEALRGSADHAAGPVVSYTGGGHVQYNLPVPQRVARRLSGTIRQTSVYMTSYDEGRREELREMLTSRIADYIWLTPVSEGGMPRHCR